MSSDRLDLLDDNAVQQIIEDHLEAFILFCTQATQGEIHTSSTLTWVINTIPTAFLNGVLRTQVEPDGLPATIASTLAVFRERHWPMTWRAGSTSSPPNLAEALAAQGLELDQLFGMALDLQNLPAAPLIPGLAIERVSSKEQVDEWVTVFGRGFGFLDIAYAAKDWFAHWLESDTPDRGAFLARLDGAPVARAIFCPCQGWRASMLSLRYQRCDAQALARL